MPFVRTDNYSSNSPHEKRKEIEAARAAKPLPDLGDVGVPEKETPAPAAPVQAPVTPETAEVPVSDMDYAQQYIADREAQLNNELSEDEDEPDPEPEEEAAPEENPDAADSVAHGIGYFLQQKSNFQDEYINKPVFEEAPAESKSMPAPGSEKKVYHAINPVMHIIPEDGGEPIQVQLHRTLDPEQYWGDHNALCVAVQDFMDSEPIIARCPGWLYDLVNRVIWDLEDIITDWMWIRKLELGYLRRKQRRERLERRWAFER